MKKTIGFLIFVIMLLNAVSLQAQNTPSQISDEQAHEIVLNGTPDDVKKLIQSGYDVNKVYHCNTLLITAIKSSVRGSFAHIKPTYAIEKIQILLDANADVNAYPCPEESMRPLAWAVTLPNQMILAGDDILKNIENKIEKGTEYCDFADIVSISKPCKDISIEEKKVIKKSITESFQMAAKLSVNTFMNIIELLVNNGADIHRTDIENQSMLHHAVINPQNITTEPVEYLIRKGVDVNSKDIYGHTPLFLAYGLKNTDIINILIKSGADTNIQANDGTTYNSISAQIKRKYFE